MNGEDVKKNEDEVVLATYDVTVIFLIYDQFDSIGKLYFHQYQLVT